MKHSKSSKKLQSGLNELPELPKPQQRWSEDDEKSKMLERRQKQARGEEICPECGGIIWNLDTCRRCGDCRCKF